MAPVFSSFFTEFKCRLTPRPPPLTPNESLNLWQEAKKYTGEGYLAKEALEWLEQGDTRQQSTHGSNHQFLLNYLPDWTGNPTDGSYIILDGRLLPVRRHGVSRRQFVAGIRYVGEGYETRGPKHFTDVFDREGLQYVDQKIREAMLANECSFYVLCLANKTQKECKYRESAILNLWRLKDGGTHTPGIYSPNLWTNRNEFHKLYTYWEHIALKKKDWKIGPGTLKVDIVERLRQDEREAGIMFLEEMYQEFLSDWKEENETRVTL